MKSFKNYNKKFKNLSRKLRKNPTKSETYLWKFALSRGQLKGYKFKRQRPIGNFIVDFFCSELNLIIELDGMSHLDKENEDEKRQRELEEMGYKVIRFSDSDVLNNLERVKIFLYDYVPD